MSLVPNFVQLEDLQRIVLRLSAPDIQPYFDKDDYASVTKVVSVFARSISEGNSDIATVERNQLRCSEAMAVASYLKSVYEGKKKQAWMSAMRRKYVAYENVSQELTRSGVRATDARIETAISGDQEYVNWLAAHSAYETLFNLFNDLKYDLRSRYEGLLEASRTHRQLIKDE